MTHPQIVEKLDAIGIDERSEHCEQTIQRQIISGVLAAMSKRDWRNGLTLGLVVGGGLALVVLLFGQKFYDLAKCYDTSQCQRSAAKYEGQDFPSWWWWDWTGSLVTSHDTLAQWIMTIFTIVAVLLVWRTLISTQDMAAKTERIGNEQVKVSIAAVNAARDANQVAAQQFRAGFKPWISVELRGPFLSNPSQIKSFPDGETSRLVALSANTTINCIGDIPATIEAFELQLKEGDQWPYVKEFDAGFGKTPERFFTILPARAAIRVDPMLGIVDPMVGTTDQQMPFNVIILTPQNRYDFMTKPPPIVGKVIYSDPMGVRYEHNFAFVASPTWGDQFKRWGGTEHNYEQEIS